VQTAPFHFFRAASPTTAQEVHQQLHGCISLILDGGNTVDGIPSTVLDCAGKIPLIVREGPITLDELLAAFSS